MEAETTPALTTVNTALAATGWTITQASINTVTGFVMIKAERHDGDHGRLVTLLRSAHGAKCLELREVTRLEPGAFRSFWTVVPGGELGRKSHMGPRHALRSLADHIALNSRVAFPSIRPRDAVRALAASC